MAMRLDSQWYHQCAKGHVSCLIKLSVKDGHLDPGLMYLQDGEAVQLIVFTAAVICNSNTCIVVALHAGWQSSS